MSSNAYQLIVHLAEAPPGESDLNEAQRVENAIKEGLRDRFVEIDRVDIREVPPPPPSKADIPVGVRVLVTRTWRDEPNIYAAKVAGYDLFRSKYRLDRELSPGHYATGGHTWAFVGEVERHPDNEAD